MADLVVHLSGDEVDDDVLLAEAEREADFELKGGSSVNGSMRGRKDKKKKKKKQQQKKQQQKQKKKEAQRSAGNSVADGVAEDGSDEDDDVEMNDAMEGSFFSGMTETTWGGASPWDFSQVRQDAADARRHAQQGSEAASHATSLSLKIAKQRSIMEKKGILDDDDEALSSSSEEEDEEQEEEEEEDSSSDEDDEEEDDDDEPQQQPAKKNKKKNTTAKKPRPAKTLQGDFTDMHLSRPLIRAIKHLGWAHPTPVQARTVPVALTGRDVLVNAATGSGKTAAFILPILERLMIRTQQQQRVSLTRVLVVTPTRELAAQCHSMTQQLAKYTNVRVCLIVGGLSLSVQETELRSRPDIVIATPGRLIDHLRNSRSVHLEDVEMLVLDEADRLLERGFADEVREVVKSCPRGRRQTMLFSATLTKQVSQLVDLSLDNPRRISVDPADGVVDTLSQEFVRIRPQLEAHREAIVLSLCVRSFKTRTIIFVRSKQNAHRLRIVFGLAGLNAAELHGNLTQLQRLESLDLFRLGRVDYLICTDLAARGLDIQGVETVINMYMPRKLEQYIHRVGRTARAGRSGRSVTLVGEAGRVLFRKVVKKAGDAVVKSRKVPQKVIAHYFAKIGAMQDRIGDVLAEEAIEKQMRIAEMEANKAKNMMQHSDAILARPARTWFQSEKEKQAAKLAGLDEHTVGELGPAAQERAEAAEKERKEKEEQEKRREQKRKKRDKDPLRGLSRKKKRTKMWRMEMEAEQREREKQLRQEGAHEDNVAPTTMFKAEVRTRVKKAELRKAKKKPANDRTTASAAAAAADTARANKRKIRKYLRPGQMVGDAELDADRGNAFDRRYGRSAERQLGAMQKREEEQLAARKKAGAKGHHKFKSKKRYKRRKG